MAPGGGMAPNWGNRVNSTSPSTILEDYHELVGTVAKVITSTLSTQEGFGSTGYDSGTNLPSGTNLQTGTGFDAGTDFGTGAKNGLNIPTFGFTTPGYGTDNFGTIDTQAFDLSTPGFEFTTPGPPVVERTAAMFVYALFLVLIPTATILGNVLVILSVLRFKALHSAINFLILGLAVADLFVAVFVMPYAVYVYIQGGNWFLGNLMCDIYSACDVACSTASIFLLAVISFDRYRAVSKPIQYSRQSQNIRRVVLILVMIWVASLALASPIVLGLNHRPEDASPYECRFYNAEFTLVSSIVSFVIPCFIVLFVYIRIMMALRKREKAAKLRRLANQQQDHKRDGSLDEVDAGQIVAAPAVNVLMLALPSMQQRMRRFERHRNALQQAGELFKVQAWMRPMGRRHKKGDLRHADAPSVDIASRAEPPTLSLPAQVPVKKLSNRAMVPARVGSNRAPNLSSQSALMQMAEMSTNAVGVATLDPEAASQQHSIRRCRFAEEQSVKEYEVEDAYEHEENEEEETDEDEDTESDDSSEEFHASAKNLFARVGCGVANMSRLTDAAISVIGARPRLSLAEPTLRKLLPPSKRPANIPDTPNRRKSGIPQLETVEVCSPQTLGLASLMPLLATGSLRRCSDSVSQMRTNSCRMASNQSLSPNAFDVKKHSLRPSSANMMGQTFGSPMTPRATPTTSFTSPEGSCNELTDRPCVVDEHVVDHENFHLSSNQEKSPEYLCSDYVPLQDYEEESTDVTEVSKGEEGEAKSEKGEATAKEGDAKQQAFIKESTDLVHYSQSSPLDETQHGESISANSLLKDAPEGEAHKLEATVMKANTTLETAMEGMTASETAQLEDEIMRSFTDPRVKRHIDDDKKNSVSSQSNQLYFSTPQTPVDTKKSSQRTDRVSDEGERLGDGNEHSQVRTMTKKNDDKKDDDEMDHDCDGKAKGMAVKAETRVDKAKTSLSSSEGINSSNNAPVKRLHTEAIHGQDQQAINPDDASTTAVKNTRSMSNEILMSYQQPSYTMSHSTSKDPPTSETHSDYESDRKEIIDEETGLKISARSAQKHREEIWEARMKFFQTGPQPVLSSRSPLMLRRFVCDPINDPENKTLQTIEQLPPFRGSVKRRSKRRYKHDHDANSSSPISSSDSLSDNLHVVTNDFVSEAPTSMSRKSSEYDSQQTNGTNNPTQTYHSRNRRLSRESSLLRNPMKRFKSLHVSPRNIALPNMDIARPGDIWRHFSRRSPRIFGPPTIPSPKLQKKYSYAEEAVFTTTTPLLDANRRKSDSSAFATTPPNELQLKDGIDTWPVDSDMQQERNDIQQLITEINTHSNQKLNLMGNEMRMKSFENDKINAKDGRNMAQNEVKMAQNEMKMAQNEMKMNILENERKISMIDNEMSPKSPSRRFEGALTSAVLGEEMDYVDVDSMHGSQTAKQTIIIYSEENTSSVTDLRDEKSPKPTEEEALNLQTSLNIMTVSSDDHSVTNEATIATDSGFGPDSKEHNEIVITNLCAKETSDTPRKISKGRRCDDAGSPTVTFKIPGKKHDKHRPDRPIKRLSSAAQIYENKRAVDKNGVTDPNDPKHKRSFSQRLRGSLGAVVGPTNSRSEHSMDSCYSSGQSQGTNTTVGAGNSSGSKDSKKGRILSNSKINGSTTELAVRMVKKAINRKESSLKRKVNKAQRKEKRATKTLGIVVGIFLVCWVPFFFINILTGICTKLDIEACQIGFGPFFYATWIGYMNSFMNPVIYTIFNTEFRRAFKSLLLGKSTNRRNRGHPV
ncbi:unnamed protein product [Bursaphelenchus okinawaensis]|uniref:G-protein coupled receptors family 1 profile domain-containing protein n=1 Tax=Bursaphelenchus okinawaensis TaxID=465554 RepID=A0A811L357_9BILA|nr:unnamed protein product [Bursaphelenchus okinawaensis]CAG9118154.1 unnamed protein product [Bursaphelenchus okinawaensis]